MTTVLSPSPKQQFLDNNGQPMVGGLLFVYEAGTSTKATTWTDSTGGTPNTNPIVLDYRGECNLWIAPNVAYKYVLAPSTDTDPPANPVWSINQVIASQLITLYGGVDGGSTNAYALSFSANFSAYTDGIVIYWVPSSSNTGASTINVNGLGVVNLVNQDDSVLRANQIVSGRIAQIIYLSGNFVLLSTFPASGSFTGTLSGVSGTVTASVQWSVSGDVACLTVPSTLKGTSNSTSCSITGLPSYLQPLTTKVVAIPAAGFLDNGAVSSTVNALMSSVSASIQFNLNGSSIGFTAANQKGVYATLVIVYSLT